MSYEFEQFTGVGGSYAPRVSIRNTGQIGLSQGLLRRVGVGAGVWFALLFFDKKRRVIGIRFTQEAAVKGTVKIQKREVTSSDGAKNWSGHIPARAFLDFCGVDYRNKKSQGFYPEFGENGMVIVMLDSGATDEADDPGDEDSGESEESEADVRDVGAGPEVG